MDVEWLLRQTIESRRSISGVPVAFPGRLWIPESGAAAAAPDGHVRLKGVIAGSITTIEILFTYPIEYIKTQLQFEGKAGAGKKYTGIWDCAVKTVKDHGFVGLYRGLSILLVFVIPKSAVRFGSFETASNYLLDSEGKLKPQNRLLAGLCAGVSEAILVGTPMETIKVKFIYDQRSSNPKFRGLFHGIGMIIKESGLWGVYKGLVPTVMKQGSNQAIRFYVMETSKEWYRGGDNSKQVPKLIIGVFGALAGGASVLGNAPIDVIKTRMQGLSASKYKNTWHCAVQMLKKEGTRAFYKGSLLRLSRCCLDVGITFMIYESFMDLLNKIWP